ncbi:MAG TPA: hypothetical protein VM144_03220 [Aestuariivirga sp.]|nr:hypothetical protein [Aestuariivirga sp.]
MPVLPRLIEDVSGTDLAGAALGMAALVIFVRLPQPHPRLIRRP